CARWRLQDPRAPASRPYPESGRSPREGRARPGSARASRAPRPPHGAYAPSRGRGADDEVTEGAHRRIVPGPLVPGQLDVDGQPPHGRRDGAQAETLTEDPAQAGGQRGHEVGGGHDRGRRREGGYDEGDLARDAEPRVERAQVAVAPAGSDFDVDVAQGGEVGLREA